MPATKTNRSFFILCALEGAAAMAALFLIPSEGGTLSLARLALIAIPFVLVILSIYAVLRPFFDLERFASPRFIVLSAVLSLTFGLLLFILRYFDPGRF